MFRNFSYTVLNFAMTQRTNQNTFQIIICSLSSPFSFGCFIVRGPRVELGVRAYKTRSQNRREHPAQLNTL